jgi:hypothetical protein
MALFSSTDMRRSFLPKSAAAPGGAHGRKTRAGRRP